MFTRWRLFSCPGEIGVDGRVVVAADAEGVHGEGAAIGQRGAGALAVEDVEQQAVLRLRRDDDHVVEVLGSGADERDAADVDLLDDVGFRGAALHGLLERIEVDNDEVDGWYVVLCHLCLVAFQVPAAEDAAEDFGVQRLDASAEDGGIGRHVLHLAAGDAEAFDELLRASRREEFHAFFVQFFEDGVKAVFVEDRHEGGLYLLRILHDECLK